MIIDDSHYELYSIALYQCWHRSNNVGHVDVAVLYSPGIVHKGAMSDRKLFIVRSWYTEKVDDR